MSPEILQSRLSKLQSADDLRTLFAALSYQAQFDDVALPNATQADAKARENLAATPEIIAVADEFQVVYAPIKDWDRAIGSERALIARLIDNFPFALWIFSDKDGQKWHFVNVKRGGKTVEREGKRATRHVLRRVSLATGRTAGRTICERLARLDLAAISSSPATLSGLQIQNVHDGAFDVEAVTKEFYNGYRRVAGDLQRTLQRQHADPVWAHVLALQTLNRLMFLRFIEKKESGGEFWMGNDPQWSLSFWKNYRAGQQTDQFYRDWLRPLFFEAFNNSFDADSHAHFSDAIRQTFEEAPYLNGGLFKENELDRRYEHEVPDAFFEALFDQFDGVRPGFFERFNFTISEDSPFDQEVAVDPEMIGHVYESLINLSELVGESAEESVGDARGDHGIFYTQRVEIDLMCRLSLGDYLFNHLEKQPNASSGLRDALLEWVFAYEPAEKEGADARIGELGLWDDLKELLKNVKVCDPACGSGAFLVGMLTILSDLSKRTNAALGESERDYDRCRRLIEEALYGVDVMDWAVHVAELRLWLQLVIENESNPRARKQLVDPEPLLPNLSFKIRPGDSLVQELGGVTLSLGDQLQMSHGLKIKLGNLKSEKRKFFRSLPGALKAHELEEREKNLFADVLLEKQNALQLELKNLKSGASNGQLFGAKPDAKIARAAEKQQSEIETQIVAIKAAGAQLASLMRPPFVWRISFYEVFDGKSGGAGFDIVVGNPPYIRNEKIADPYLSEEKFKATQSEIWEAELAKDQSIKPDKLADAINAKVEADWKASKTSYKAKLQKSVQAAWPQFFEGGKRKLDGKSDLYIYFFLHGLKLLAPGGAFCFITSNSWLDVGYGADLQEFLLQYGRVRTIFDNEVQRSFKSADVNTAVALLGRGEKTPKANADAMARFVMWRVPFESASNALVWQEIEAAGGRLVREEFRLRPFSQAELLKDGADPEKAGVYGGNKWGGKFLRAPDIYDVILEKGKDKLVRLGDVADVRFGIKTGANEFFFLNEAEVKEWEIEEEFLSPVARSPKECRRINLRRSDLKVFLLNCHKERSELKNTNLLEYIKWGESRRFNVRPSTVGRARWWDVGNWTSANLLWVEIMFDSYRVHRNAEEFLESDKFYGITTDGDADKLCLDLNSTWTMMLKLNSGFSSLGEGALKTSVAEVKSFKVPHGILKATDIKKFAGFMNREILSVHEEIKQPDRRELDEIVFNAFT